MTLHALLALKRGPVSSLGFSVSAIDPYLAQIDGNTFLLLSEYGPDLSILSESEVSHVIWASSIGAIHRVMNREIEADDGVSSLPPTELTFGSTPTYGALLSRCKALWPSATLETASYRIATDGLFICRNIETPKVAYHFRSPKHDDSEVPFVIKHKLPQG